MGQLLIIGNGMAAGKLVQELVRHGCRDEITLAGQEGPGVYNRILLTPYLTQSHDREEFWLLDEAWFHEHRIGVVSGVKAVHVDRAAKTVAFDDGRQIGYDTLVLALGSRPFQPPIQGLGLDGVHSLRSMADGDRIREDLAVPRKVLVIGGGLIGVETAWELAAAGHLLTVVQSSAGLMDRHLDATGSDYLKRHLEQAGVRVMTTAVCTALEGAGPRVSRAKLASGEVIETDLVLISAGVVPVTDLARGCGLDVGRGIRVDDHLRSSDPAIFAVGECLEWRDRTWGLMSSTFEQARILAQGLVGEPVAYTPSLHPPTRLKSPLFAASLGSMEARADDQVFEFKDPDQGIYKKVIVRDGRLWGAQAVGSLSETDPSRWDALEVLYSSDAQLTQSPGQLLFAPQKMDATEARTWPDNLRICNCNGVLAGDIRSAIAAGSLSPEAVMKVTRAGTGCSSCRGRLRALVEAEVGAPRSEGRWKRWKRAYREKEIRGFTPFWIVSYIVDYFLVFCALVVLVTGIVKFPGFLAWAFVSVHDWFPDLHLSVRKLTLAAEQLKDLLAWWHDWIGLAMTGGVLLHLIIHWGMLLSFLRSMFPSKRRPKAARSPVK